MDDAITRSKNKIRNYVTDSNVRNFTSKGVFSAAISVNPTMSLKYTVTAS